MIANKPAVNQMQQRLEEAITTRLAQLTGSSVKDRRWPLWRVNRQFSIYATAIPASRKNRARRMWGFYGNRAREAEYIVLARLGPACDQFIDYFVFPNGHKTPILLFDHNPRWIELRRFADLNFLNLLCSEAQLKGDPR